MPVLFPTRPLITYLFHLHPQLHSTKKTRNGNYKNDIIVGLKESEQGTGVRRESWSSGIRVSVTLFTPNINQQIHFKSYRVWGSLYRGHLSVCTVITSKYTINLSVLPFLCTTKAKCSNWNCSQKSNYFICLSAYLYAYYVFISLFHFIWYVTLICWVNTEQLHTGMPFWVRQQIMINFKDQVVETTQQITKCYCILSL